MKTFYSLLFICFFYSMSAQIVITEISYNPPEGGNDSLEYIEIYNAGDMSYDLDGVNFSDGIVYEFSNTSIEANTFICVAINAVAMENVFGKTCFQWESGALKNGGELVRLVDSNSVELDAVEFQTAAPWPSAAEGTNGNGASIVLCDVDADNSLGESWSAATNNIGVEINGKMVKGSPAEDNAISCEVNADYTIEALPSNTFSPADITINPGETVRWVNSGGFHNVNGTKATFPDNPESFTNGDPSTDAWTFDYTFFVEGVYQYQCNPHSGLGMKGSVTVGIPKTFPTYDIGVLRAVNVDGIPDSIGISCEISGTVHGVNYSTTGGLSFFLIDDSHDGISVYNQNNTLDYTVAEGDALTVKGTVDQFNGLTQFTAETIIVNGTGTLQTPITVDSIFEMNEAQLVKLENFTYVDIEDWRGNGSSFNVSVTNGDYTATMRISEFTDLASMPAPTAPFNLVGLVNQYDFNEPFLEFYQLFPRSANDITSVSSTNEAFSEAIKISPNPTSGNVTIQRVNNPDEVCLYNMSGELMNIWKTPGNQVELNAQSGLYILSIQKGNEKVFNKVIIAK